MPSDHAIRRVTTRFGIPKSKAHSWIHRKLSSAKYKGKKRGLHWWENGGAKFGMNGRVVVTIIQSEKL